MRLKVTHQTDYQYSRLVYLEPHTLYLHPPTYPYQSVAGYRLQLEPEPPVFTRANDLEGNSVYLACFQELTDRLTIRTEFEVETSRTNPFDYVVFPFEACNLPFQYPLELHPLLKPYLKPASRNNKLENFALECAAQAQQGTLRMLMCLTETIHDTFAYEFREFGEPRTAEETLRLHKGSCRDFAILMIDTCRVLGIAARFASGYFFDEPHKEKFLHAWVEVYLPGAGWRGYDPTQGLVAADRHVVLASSAYPALVTPVQGTFRGDATARLHTFLDITPLD